MNVELKSVTPNAEMNIVQIARVSSNRQDKKENPEGLINYLIKNKHWSPFEHSFLTFEIVTSKAIGIQLLRHRSFTFQEFSQRYAEVTEFEEFELRRKAEKNRQSSEDVFNPNIWMCDGVEKWESPADNIISHHLEASIALYKSLLEAGVAKECARMVLPMCTQTTIYMSGSVRSWIHFLALRDDSHSQKEAQLIAKKIKEVFIEHLPIISKALNYN